MFRLGRRDGRVAERARLESVFAEMQRGFESLSLRQNLTSLRYSVITPALIRSHKRAFTIRDGTFSRDLEGITVFF